MPGIFLLLALRFLAIWLIPPGGDEVVQLYIADDIARFRQLPIYFYDQALMGTLESYFLAPVFKLFGFSFLAGRIAYSLFYFSFMAMFLGVTRRLFGRELSFYLLILLSILPFPALFFTTVIGWAEIPMLAILSLVLLLKAAHEEPGRLGWPSLGLGFVCGIAFWCNPLFAVWLVPIGISLIGLGLTKGARLPAGFLLGLLVGLFPVWIHGLRTGILMNLSDRGGGGFVALGDLARVFYLFFARMKYFLSTFSFGPVSPWSDQLIRGLSFIPFLIFSISFGSLVLYFLRSYKRLKREEKIFYSFVILPPLVLMLLYCSRNFIARDEGMRFFVQLLAAYPFAVAWQLERLKSTVWKKGCLGILLGVLILGNLFSGREMVRRGSELRNLAQFLEREGLRFGIADIGIAYPLNVLTRHRVLTTPLLHHAASDSIWERVKAGGPRFLILERQNPQLRGDVERDPHLKKTSVGAYDVFYGESDYLSSILDVREPILG